MCAAQFMLGGCLAALLALTAACNAILGVNDVTEAPVPDADAGANAHPCDVAPDFPLITVTPSTSLLVHHMTDGGASLVFLLNDDDKPDGLVMDLYDNLGGHGVVNAVSSYPLTTADAWLVTCAICVGIYTDFDSSAKTFSQSYFAAAQGTLTLNMFDATGIAGSLKRFKLREVVLSDDTMFDVVDGCSVTLEDVEFAATWSTITSPSAPNNLATVLSARTGSPTPVY